MGANPLLADIEEKEKMGVQAVEGDLAPVRWCSTIPIKLAQAVLRLTFAARGRHNRVRYLNERRRDGKTKNFSGQRFREIQRYYLQALVKSFEENANSVHLLPIKVI